MLSDPRFWSSKGQPFRGALNGTTIVKVYDFAMKYSKKEGVGCLYYDLPRATKELSRKQLELLEAMSNTGCEQEGIKYNGSTVVVRAHIIVFSNHPPPKELLHKKIMSLRVTSAQQPAEELEWTWPGQLEDGSFNITELERELLEKAKDDVMFRQAVVRVAQQLMAPPGGV